MSPNFSFRPFFDDAFHNKPAHAVPLASARQHPGTCKPTSCGFARRFGRRFLTEVRRDFTEVRRDFTGVRRDFTEVRRDFTEVSRDLTEVSRDFT